MVAHARLRLPPRTALPVVMALVGLLTGCADTGDGTGDDTEQGAGPVTASATHSVPASGPSRSAEPLVPTTSALPSSSTTRPSASNSATASAPDETGSVNPVLPAGDAGAGGGTAQGAADAGAGGAPQAGGQPTNGAGGESVSGGGVPAAAGQTGVGGAAGNNAADAGGAGGSDAGAAAGNTCEGGKVVHFVYFVEADQAYSESQHADIERHAYAFQAYFYEQLGVTFYLNEPVVEVIEADQDSDWYVNTPDDIHNDSRWYRLGNVKKEVYSKLGIQDFDADHRVVNYPTTRFDGRVGGNFGGAWMDGDDLTCIADDGPTYPYDDGGVAHCMGHPVHEFGHILGLDHEGPDEDCMQYGFYTQTVSGMCDFSAANIDKILANPDNEGWFEALPTETCVGR